MARYFSWQRLKFNDTRLMGDGVVLLETLACNLAIKCRQIPENNWLQNVDSVGQNDIRAFTGIQAFKFFFCRWNWKLFRVISWSRNNSFTALS